MRITFPARYCENYGLSINKSESVKLVSVTLEELNWRYVLAGDGEFQAQISFNFWSFGEKIKIIILNEGIQICSECVSPFQYFDWGKNKENVRTFLNQLEKINLNLFSEKPFQTVESFDEKGFSPVERIFTDSE